MLGLVIKVGIVDELEKVLRGLKEVDIAICQHLKCLLVMSIQ
jgi:hypothetical protein